MIYFIRHGQTPYNKVGKLQGILDIPLSAIGRKQAKVSAEKLKEYKIDIIYSSPLKRTLSTANFINKYHNLNIITDKRIVERGFGNFEGTKNVLSNISDYLDFELNLNTNNVESIQALFKRINDFLFLP